jgi:hypothetical protein
MALIRGIELNNTVSIEKKNILDISFTGEKLYFLAFVLYFTSAFMITTTYLEFISFHWLNYISYIAIGLLAGKMFLFDSYTRTQIITYIVVIASSLITWISTNTSLGFISVMFILAARGVNFKKIVYWYFVLGTIFMIFAFVSSQFGIIKNLIYHRSGTTRQSFGIIYPTDFAAHVFFLILAYCYLWFKKLNVISYCSFFLIALLIIHYCDARLDALCILLVIPVMFIAKHADKESKLGVKLSAVYWISIPFMSVLVLLATYFFDWNNKLFQKANNLFSSRLSLSNEGFTNYGFSWFGKPIVEHGWGGLAGSKAYSGSSSTMKYFMLDSSIVRIFIVYGTLFSVVLLFALAVRSITQLKEKNYVFTAIILLVMVSSVVDQHLIDLAYNPFLIGICAMFTHEVTNKINIKKL